MHAESQCAIKQSVRFVRVCSPQSSPNGCYTCRALHILHFVHLYFWFLSQVIKGTPRPGPGTFLQYDYLMSHFVYRFWELEWGPNSQSGVTGISRSRPFPRIKAPDSSSRIMGMSFFIPNPVSDFGNAFFDSLPVPELWGCFFFIPFPSPNCGNDFFSFPCRSRICHFTDGNQNRNWNTVRDTRLSIFSASSTFLTTTNEAENWAKECRMPLFIQNREILQRRHVSPNLRGGLHQ